MTFPRNVNNEGIKFDENPEVEIVFKTNVIAKTPPYMKAYGAHNEEAAQISFGAQLSRAAFAPALRAAASPDPTTKRDKDSVLTQLSYLIQMKQDSIDHILTIGKSQLCDEGMGLCPQHGFEQSQQNSGTSISFLLLFFFCFFLLF